MTQPTPDPFTIPGREWVRLDPAYLRMKRLLILITWPIFFAICALAAFLFTKWSWTILALAIVGLVWTSWRWLRQARVFANWGYAEGETDLYIRQGLWQRKMTVIPYSRMQLVNLDSGPIERSFNLATVTYVTASMESDGEIPGLNTTVAASLRDRLAANGQDQQAGL